MRRASSRKRENKFSRSPPKAEFARKNWHALKIFLSSGRKTGLSIMKGIELARPSFFYVQPNHERVNLTRSDRIVDRLE